MIVLKLIPEDRIAVISLSSENCPNDINAATRTAIGTDNAVIQPRFKKDIQKLYLDLILTNESVKKFQKKLGKKDKTIISNEKKMALIAV